MPAPQKGALSPGQARTGAVVRFQDWRWLVSGANVSAAGSVTTAVPLEYLTLR
jgi:hypothetical protein